MLRPKITACIFDMDGLLLDTETSYTVAQQQICQRFGKDFTWSLKAKMMGRKAIEAAEIFIQYLNLQGKITADEFLKEREEILDRLFASAPLLPGVDRLIRHLHACGIPIAVATSSHRRHFELKTQQHQELFSLFDCIVTGDQVKVSKPAPDIFLLALEQLNHYLKAVEVVSPPSDSPSGALTAGGVPLLPQNTLVFEDAPTGVDAGLAAGMQVLMVPDINLETSLRGKAHQEVESLELFIPDEWGLPPYVG
ncbi:hypothetical protein CEUSTIGMA_g6437.t1 [Chlamydomonas eustigma]|uniref:Uncharacterized protein n=1 Tax=Chlamydomonas eustigma TaxID=1157962 RepID=A0A250X7F2_9CHLO|nr:hypothetical protein CEUSTIGMA_g6437.t1 [Chlamydomonas eustigma]|eukprot:GAX78997.1 hypothetical protein CEUSTIGMA_g6437.t1 [Chlamydomonas eustigma]